LARKVNFYTDIERNGVSIAQTVGIISWVAETSLDDIVLNQQYFIVPANTTLRDFNINLRDDAEFTYFHDSEQDVLSSVEVLLNNKTTSFKISPEFYTEEIVTRIRASNSSSRDKTIYVFQLFSQGVDYGEA
jgi:hypothetical protein